MADFSPRSEIERCKNFYRRKFPNDLVGLKAEADRVFAASFDEVTVTTTGFEGGHVGGQVKFNKAYAHVALEELIEELEPTTLPPQRASGSVIEFQPDL